MDERAPPDPLDLNQIVSLPQEKQSISILQWLVDCESFLVNSSPEQVSEHQQTFRQAFINLLSLPTPPLGRVLRNCLGRCFSDIFSRGDRKVLFDTVTTLLQKVAHVRNDKETKQKQCEPLLLSKRMLLTCYSATVFCLGVILAVAGDSVMQLIPEVVSALIRIIRASQMDVGIRAIAFASLRKAFIKQGHIKDENMGRDLIKITRHGLADKSHIIQLRAAQVSSYIDAEI